MTKVTQACHVANTTPLDEGLNAMPNQGDANVDSWVFQSRNRHDDHVIH